MLIKLITVLLPLIMAMVHKQALVWDRGMY